MKAWHWILIAVAVAGAGFAVWWFKFRKPAHPALPVGDPRYTPPTVQGMMPQPAGGKVTSNSITKSLGATLQNKASTLVSAMASKGIDSLENAISDWF